MKKLVIFLFAIALSSMMIAQSSKTFNLGSFTSIAISNSTNVELRQGSQSIEAKGSQESIDQLDLEVERNTLKVQSKKSKNYKSKGRVTLYISVPDLNNVVISGSGDVVLKSGFDFDRFAMTISGSGNVTSESAINADDIAIVVSGSGDITLKGNAPKQSITVSGSGDIEVSGLKGKSVAIVNSGSGDIGVYASESVKVVNTGSGDVSVSGNPQQKKIMNTGSGDIDYE